MNFAKTDLLGHGNVPASAFPARDDLLGLRICLPFQNRGQILWSTACVGESLQIDRTTAELISRFEILPCTQCVVESNGEVNRRFITNLTPHSNYVINLFPYGVGLDLRVARVQYNAFDTRRTMPKQTGERFPGYLVHVAAFVFERETRFSTPVTGKMEDFWFDFDHGPLKVDAGHGPS